MTLDNHTYRYSLVRPHELHTDSPEWTLIALGKTSTLQSALRRFATKHELIHPQRQCLESETELATCLFFTEAPISVECEFVATPPTQGNDLSLNKYLWVIAEDAVPFGKEAAENVYLKHTNLTGGKKAYCGGEVWFADKERIYLNGGSGRYPCEHDEDLLDSVKNFYMEIGYGIAVPPFDEDSGRRPRVFKSEAMVEWQSHVG